MSARRPFALSLCAATLLIAGAASAAPDAGLDAGLDAGRSASEFAFDPPGSLVKGSGMGRVDEHVYAPGIRFPIESGPAFANSQVWGNGGLNGPKGSSQCDDENRSYPWHDNYCETRDYDMPLCPAGNGHQGQDIRAATCEKGVHWTVAVVDGTITNIGTYSVYLTAADGTRFDYLHMEQLQIKEGQKVKRGDRMGKVSNQFGTDVTTIHLHFNIHQNVEGVGMVYVPPYLSLVQAYERLIEPAIPDAGPPDAAPPPVFDASMPDAAAPPPSDGDPGSDGGCAVATGPDDATSLASLATTLMGLMLGMIAVRRRR